MSVASSHTEAVDRLGRALGAFGEQAGRAAESAVTQARRVLATTEEAVRDRQSRLAEAQRAEQACRSDPDARCEAEAQRVADALRRLAAAREARALAEQAVAQVSAAQRRFLAESGARIADGRAITSRKGGDLEAYLRALGGTALGSAAGGACAASSGAAGTRGAGLPAGVCSAPGLPAGYGLVPLALIDTSRDPVTGPADFGKGYGPQDLAWAFSAFDDVVLPTLAGGGGPDYFATRDAAESRIGTRSYADTHSGFLSTGEAIALTLRPDGRFEVANGRHRIWVAQQLGRDSVPARFI